MGNFNLAPPPNFRGLDPEKPISVYYRDLPHWRQEGATYFVTFRLGDSLPQSKLDYLRRWRVHWMKTHPEPRSKKDWEDYARTIMQHQEQWLDEGHGNCHFQSPEMAHELQRCLMKFQGIRYLVSCWAIMPNHCHLVIRPFENWALEDLLQSFKGVSARQINLALNQRGSMWQDESYDRIVRDEEHLYRVVQYIGRNPAKAKLARESWRRWVHPDWQAAGWRFSVD